MIFTHNMQTRALISSVVPLSAELAVRLAASTSHIRTFRLREFLAKVRIQNTQTNFAFVIRSVMRHFAYRRSKQVSSNVHQTLPTSQITWRMWVYVVSPLF